MHKLQYISHLQCYKPGQDIQTKNKGLQEVIIPIILSSLSVTGQVTRKSGKFP